MNLGVYNKGTAAKQVMTSAANLQLTALEAWSLKPIVDSWSNVVGYLQIGAFSHGKHICNCLAIEFHVHVKLEIRVSSDLMSQALHFENGDSKAWNPAF